MATRVIGVKPWKDGFRYAVLAESDGNIAWENRDAEHKWLVPAVATSRQEQIEASYREFDRILGVSGRIDSIALKLPEYGRKFDISTGNTVAICTSIMLASQHRHIVVQESVYTNIKLNSSTVEAYVLEYVTKPAKYWDVQLADAIAVSLKKLGKQ